eukprot:scaffold73176_cov41-Attheya_sp.AAC.3
MSSWTSGSSFMHPKDDVVAPYAAYGSIPTNGDEHEHEHEHDAASVQHVENKRNATARSKTRSWSFHDDAGGAPLQRHPSLMRHVHPADTTCARTHNKVDRTTKSNSSSNHPNDKQQPSSSKKKGGAYGTCFIILFLAPGLYGYAAVIFNHEAFSSHMNALSKLVIFSSLIHQLAFTLFSGLPFAIGTVQDAGLIFLSAMANIIANEILNDGDEDGEGGGTIEEVVSTTLVLLPLGTALLGVVLMVMGKFRLADAVSYLPMPVVGGYLAFIGYFCLEAGVALCISEAMVGLQDWAYLLQWEKF